MLEIFTDNKYTTAEQASELSHVYRFTELEVGFMGKGDRKTKRGKIWRGTYGVKRRKKKKVASTQENS